MGANLRDLHRRLRAAAAALPLALVLAGCDVTMGNLSSRATDLWTRTYPITNDGQLEIVNTNGQIDIEGVEGSIVEVRAERIARAATEAGARDLLPRIEIEETIEPHRIRIATGRMEGIMIGAGFEVRYFVKAPKGMIVRVTNTNGQVTATGMTGRLIARTTNGAVNARNVTGEIEAQTTNGGVTVDLAALTAKISLETTNGGVSLIMPDDAKADLRARCRNGGISVSGLKLETTESSRRRVEGKLNGGGIAVDLRTTNGGIKVRSRTAPA